jgi:hypothetical protein
MEKTEDIEDFLILVLNSYWGPLVYFHCVCFFNSFQVNFLTVKI